jgi:hypothetical protein
VLKLGTQRVKKSAVMQLVRIAWRNMERVDDMAWEG